MNETLFHGRRAVQLENDNARVTCLLGGGHIAEFLHKGSGVSPLWIPPWDTMEPEVFDPYTTKGYGSGYSPEAKLLAGIMGHNLCLDLFGGPSSDENKAGVTVHGEASIATYECKQEGEGIRMSAMLSSSSIAFSRFLRLDGLTLHIEETVDNRAILDRPIAWTQHVTLGPPFIQPGKTTITVPVTHGRTYEAPFGNLYGEGVDFYGLRVPRKGRGEIDLRTYPADRASAGYTAHLLDPNFSEAVCEVSTGELKCTWRWTRWNFPWLGLWIENGWRTHPPWNGRTTTLGLEFGVSPMPQSRREMIERGPLFGCPCYRWLPARRYLTASYSVTLSHTPATEG